MNIREMSIKERENDREKSQLGVRSRVGFCVLVKIIQYFLLFELVFDRFCQLFLCFFSNNFLKFTLFSHWIGRMDYRRNNIMSNKRILPSIGLEGTKEELLEFLSDFEINKIVISFVDNRMVFTTSVPVDDELMDIYKQAYGIY